MPSSWTQNYYHIVTGTLKRVPYITPEIHERLYPFFGGIAKDLGVQLLAANGMSDHAHLLIRFPSDMAPSVMVQNFKARTSSWISETFLKQHDFSWQKGYGGFTVSHSNVPVVEEYIRNQQAHHKHLSFAEEFEELLRRHEIPFDPKYLD
jgi:REP element-mobilizing transposase RayT